MKSLGPQLRDSIPKFPLWKSTTICQGNTTNPLHTHKHSVISKTTSRWEQCYQEIHFRLLHLCQLYSREEVDHPVAPPAGHWPAWRPPEPFCMTDRRTNQDRIDGVTWRSVTSCKPAGVGWRSCTINLSKKKTHKHMFLIRTPFKIKCVSVGLIVMPKSDRLKTKPQMKRILGASYDEHVKVGGAEWAGFKWSNHAPFTELH